MTQPTLFDQVFTPTGKELAKAGMQRAIDTTERVHDNWSENAYAMLEKYLNDNNAPFQCEDFRGYASGNGLPKPVSNRAFGGVIQKAAKNNLIVKIGVAEVDNPLAHSCFSSIWIKK